MFRVKVKNKKLDFEYSKIAMLISKEKKRPGKGSRGSDDKRPELVK